MISRYSAYSANQVMTSTAATNMISKKSTTERELTWDNSVTHNSPGNVDLSYRDVGVWRSFRGDFYLRISWLGPSWRRSPWYL
ncbi:Uncharacterised protein [Mycobacteroides abscessus subsp. abscessus]|nr:Uncharacterised protein [Mycobacteroides abscessus subsp. abscessus]SIN56201.1 Uncharacterised protein [Mycobacteroides abscessus subsp. abscessus]SKU18572.1 Uncharacterised protein [Mycobacteroides abscessus subsp. abscessus]SKX20163.1 Uncharacterised protein [Mycobacteroides abscessus subsp. abscessus]